MWYTLIQEGSHFRYTPIYDVTPPLALRAAGCPSKRWRRHFIGKVDVCVPLQRCLRVTTLEVVHLAVVKWRRQLKRVPLSFHFCLANIRPVCDSLSINMILITILRLRCECQDAYLRTVRDWWLCMCGRNSLDRILGTNFIIYVVLTE